VSYLESTVPATACEIAVSIKTASCAGFGLSSAISPSTVYLLHYLRPTATAMVRKKATTDELDAHATANDYQRGGHREEDNRRDGKKHGVKTGKDQDATLDLYVI
jgi:hypothetical protein